MRLLISAVAALALLAGLALPTLAGAVDFQGVIYLSAYDGDTIRVTIPGVSPFFGANIPIRLRGLDTPEIRGKCNEEKAAARDARDRLRELLEQASRIDLIDAKRGKYFRLIATVQADGVDVAALLIQEGHARPYEGGTRAGWCQ